MSFATCVAYFAIPKGDLMAPADPALAATEPAALADEVPDWRFKAIPTDAYSRMEVEYPATAPRLSGRSTSLLTLDAGALDANLARMSAFCSRSGVELAARGKTTTALALWGRQLAAGAVARAAGRGAAAVKILPAASFGPRYFRD
jgi:hypothetical protein